ncbi:MAG: V-type ATP synthase subunit E family protein [candidate division WOR-3 bacterium]|nr:V-type ATP synthase subunit E family protein [candidate division WOR-3 bacterium]
MDKVSQKILDDAKKEGAKIIKEAEKKRKEIEEETEREMKKLTEETDKKMKEREEREYERWISLKEVEQRKALLEYKHNLMSKLFKEVRAEILKGDRYHKLIESLFKMSVESGREEVLVGKDEKFITKEFIDKLNKDKNWHLKLSDERIPIKGGFVLKSEKTRIDASIETIIREKKELLEVTLVDILFKEK